MKILDDPLKVASLRRASAQVPGVRRREKHAVEARVLEIDFVHVEAKRHAENPAKTGSLEQLTQPVMLCERHFFRIHLVLISLTRYWVSGI